MKRHIFRYHRLEHNLYDIILSIWEQILKKYRCTGKEEKLPNGPIFRKRDVSRDPDTHTNTWKTNEIKNIFSSRHHSPLLLALMCFVDTGQVSLFLSFRLPSYLTLHSLLFTTAHIPPLQSKESFVSPAQREPRRLPPTYFLFCTNECHALRHPSWDRLQLCPPDSLLGGASADSRSFSNLVTLYSSGPSLSGRSSSPSFFLSETTRRWYSNRTDWALLSSIFQAVSCRWRTSLGNKKNCWVFNGRLSEKKLLSTDISLSRSLEATVLQTVLKCDGLHFDMDYVREHSSWYQVRPSWSNLFFHIR